MIAVVTAVLLTRSRQGEIQRFEVELVGTFSQPSQLVSADDRLWVVERTGRIVSSDAETVLVDLTPEVGPIELSEAGLLGLAFGDDWPDGDPRFWVYAAQGQTGRSWLAQYEYDGHTSTGTGRVIRQWDESTAHHGGHLEWHEGRLYVGVGDGASGPDDPRARHAQQPNADRGAILRWSPQADVWETVAHGLRNPWGWTLQDGWLYVADVGHGLYEEISTAPLGSLPNFGWPHWEGPACIREPCRTDVVMPQIWYAHGPSCAAIIGGPIYEGRELRWLRGALVWSDFCRGHLEAAWFEDGVVVEQRAWPSLDLGPVTAIGTTPEGELVVGLLTGDVMRIASQ